MLTLEELLAQTAVNTTELLAPKEEEKKEDGPEHWKPKNEVTPSRLVSFEHEGKMVPFAEVNVHYVKNKAGKIIKVFRCPNKKKYDQDCPMCLFGWGEYKRLKDLGSKDKAFKRFLPSQESVSLFIDRETEEAEFNKLGYPVLKCFKYPNKVKEMIEAFLKDPEYGDISHLTKGTDIKINYSEAQAKLQQLSLTVTAARSSSPIFNKKFADVEKDQATFIEVYQNMMKNACDPFSRFETLNSDQILEVMRSMSEETSDKEEVEQHSGTAENNASEEDKMNALKRDLALK